MGYKSGELLNTGLEIYTVGRQRGCGGSGEVYEVKDADGSPFAVKILDTTKANRTRLKRFQNEIHFCSTTEHRNVVRVVAHGVTGKGATFYVMPLYSGTLRDLMSKGLPPEAVLPYFGQLLNGLEAAHMKRVWHRDIKPENILHDQREDFLLVADFGIAHFEEEELFTAVETRNDDRLANFVYSAPEQKVRGKQVGDKADIYALGLILNEMFTGEVPLGAHYKKIASCVADFVFVDDIVERMITQEPTLRPSIVDIKQQLIARRQQFISLQKLDELSKQVVLEDSITDPLIADPIRAENFDYENGFLVVTLSRAPNPLWEQTFHTQETRSFLHMGPGTVTFLGTRAEVPVKKDIVVQQRDYFEGWLRNTNGLYEGAVKQRIAEDKRMREQQLEQQLARERERRDILKLLNPS